MCMRPPWSVYRCWDACSDVFKGQQYAGMETALDNLGLVEIEETIDLGFNTKKYLPEGFNPYQGMIFAIEDIVVIEEEEEFILDFNTKKYLPNSFNALSK